MKDRFLTSATIAYSSVSILSSMPININPPHIGKKCVSAFSKLSTSYQGKNLQQQNLSKRSKSKLTGKSVILIRKSSIHINAWQKTSSHQITKMIIITITIIIPLS